MKDKMNATGNQNSAGGCDRSEELVAYLYGEANPIGEGEFDAHLEACAACREELSAFGDIRHSIALWRAEAESHAPALELSKVFAADRAQPSEAIASEPVTRATFAPQLAVRRRSARAALREFFTLSPLWLRAGFATAALVVCALATLTLVRGEVTWDEKGFALRAVDSAPAGTQPALGLTERPEAVVYTQEQVEALIAERVAREVAAARERFEAAGRREASVAASDVEGNQAVSGSATRKQAPRVVAAADRSINSRRAPTSVVNRRRDAVAGADEESLPRLSDLLGGAYD
jgi:hypothetical protein